MLYLGIPPDLSDWLFFCAKHMYYLVSAQYKALLYAQASMLVLATAGEQYRQHIRNGGYRP